MFDMKGTSVFTKINKYEWVIPVKLSRCNRENIAAQWRLRQLASHAVSDWLSYLAECFDTRTPGTLTNMLRDNPRKLSN